MNQNILKSLGKLTDNFFKFLHQKHFSRDMFRCYSNERKIIENKTLYVHKWLNRRHAIVSVSYADRCLLQYT